MDNTHECPNCGNTLGPNDYCCKYCGTKNPNYVRPAPSIFATPVAHPTASPAQPVNQESAIGNIITAFIFDVFFPIVGFFVGLAGIRKARNGTEKALTIIAALLGLTMTIVYIALIVTAIKNANATASRYYYSSSKYYY